MYVFLETDSFSKNAMRVRAKSMVSDDTPKSDPDADPSIRRPLRGIQIKDDTYAVLSVRRPDGSSIPLFSSSAVNRSVNNTDQSIGKVTDYADFLLQRVDDQRREKNQIIETFGEAFVYFFGERPRIVAFNGYLLNTEDFNWHAQFWHNYEKHLRGTKLVQQNARCYLAYDSVVVEGYPLAAGAVMQAENTNIIPFTLTVLVTNYHEYSTVGLMRFPGVGQESIEVLNKTLDKRRGGFVSSTAEVRKGNLDWVRTRQIPGPKDSSPLAYLRKGIQSYNEMMSWAGRQINKASRIASGRALRMPIGLASYYANLGYGPEAGAEQVTVAYGSITTSAQRALDATSEAFGAVDVNGNKIYSPVLRMMGPAKFSASWESAYFKGSSRGFIFENYDEYPLRKHPKSLQEISQKAASTLEQRNAERIAYMTSRESSFRVMNMMAARGGVLEDVAAAVQATRDGFGMVSTVLDTVDDPLGKLTQQLGVSVPDLERIGMGAVRRLVPPLLFVGTSIGRTFESQVEDALDTSVEELFHQGDTEEGAASIGDVYKQSTYKSGLAREDYDYAAYEQSDYASNLAREVDYEPVYAASGYNAQVSRQGDVSAAYGVSDYTSLLDRQGDLDALAEATTGTESRLADEIRAALSEAYGDTDASAYGDGRQDPAALNEVYNREDTIQQQQLTAEDRAAALLEAYSASSYVSNLVGDDGITAAEDDDTVIEPTI